MDIISPQLFLYIGKPTQEVCYSSITSFHATQWRRKGPRSGGG